MQPFDMPTRSRKGSSLVRDALCAQLLEKFEDPSYEPPVLPSVALELMTLSAQDDVDAGEVVQVLERDEVLAAKVVRLVSSPLYAGRTRVRTLHDAVVRLGINMVRDAVFEASVKQQVFDRGEYRETLEQLRRHSTVVAYISRLVCRRTSLEPNHAFICGLLHDIGFAALLLATGDGSETPPLLSIWSDIDALHEHAGDMLTRLWKLPEDIVGVVKNHHQRQHDNDSLVAAAVCIADDLSRAFGADLVGAVASDGAPVPADASSVEVLERCKTRLHIDERTYQSIVDEAEQLVPEILWL